MEKFIKIKEFIKKEKILYHIETIFLLFLPILITLDKYINLVGTILTGIPLIVGILSVVIYQKRTRIKYGIIGVVLTINMFLITNYTGQLEFIKPLLIMFTCFDMVQDEDFLKIIKKYFEKYYKAITISIGVILALNILSIVLDGSGYSNVWKIEAFEGLYHDFHQAAYRICTLIIYILFLIKLEKSNNIVNIILLVLCEYLLLKTGARTPTVLGISLGMIGIYFIKDKLLEIYNRNKKKSIVFIIVAILLLAVALPQTAFVKKMITSSQKSFDNGRTILRNAEMEHFINSDIQNKMFGNDIDIIREVNFKVIYAKIWCHNDIMQILLQFGVFMLIIYFETVIRAMIFQLQGQCKFNKAIIVLLNLVYLFVAFFNGLFFHPRFVVAIPIIFAIFKLYEMEQIESNEIVNEENN